MSRVLKASFAYFGLIFALGFAVGTVRVLADVPSLGETGAVVLELPIMLAASWLVCGWLIGRFGLLAQHAFAAFPLVQGGRQYGGASVPSPRPRRD